MDRKEATAFALAAFQAADLVVTSRSAAYGAAHLDHLGVPRWLRPYLPILKAGAVAALVASAHRPTLRAVVASGLVAYYSAAAEFHRQSDDAISVMAPALGCGVLAASLV